MGKLAYTKCPLTEEQHLQLLIKRKLIVANPDKVLHFLKYIGYYRLSGYALPFQIKEADLSRSKHTFRDGVTFEMILDLYIFDRELRLIVMDAIERIEVAVRAAISNTLCQKYGTHWFMDKNRFHHTFKHDEFISDLRRELKLNTNGELHKSKDVFLRHYYEKYSSPEFPPCWMMSEVLTVGRWSILYAHIHPSEDRARISERFNLHHHIFGSWLHSLTYIRNLCAHHARLWNRWFAITPKIIDLHRSHLEPNHTFYAQAAMLHILNSKISPDSHWPMKIHALMQKHPSVPMEKMGFKENWHTDSFWV